MGPAVPKAAGVTGTPGRGPFPHRGLCLSPFCRKAKPPRAPTAVPALPRCPGGSACWDMPVPRAAAMGQRWHTPRVTLGWPRGEAVAGIGLLWLPVPVCPRRGTGMVSRAALEVSLGTRLPPSQSSQPPGAVLGQSCDSLARVDAGDVPNAAVLPGHRGSVWHHTLGTVPSVPAQLVAAGSGCVAPYW